MCMATWVSIKFILLLLLSNESPNLVHNMTTSGLPTSELVVKVFPFSTGFWWLCSFTFVVLKPFLVSNWLVLLRLDWSILWLLKMQNLDYLMLLVMSILALRKTSKIACWQQTSWTQLDKRFLKNVCRFKLLVQFPQHSLNFFFSFSSSSFDNFIFIFTLCIFK